MIIVFIAFLFEFLLCNIIIAPNNGVEHNMAAWLLLEINIIFVFLAICKSVKNKENFEEERSVKKMILSSFFIRIAVMFWDVYARNIFILPNSEGDAEWYYIDAIKYAFGSRADKVDTGRYAYYVGQLYKVIGVQKITVQFLHIFFAICSIVLIYKMLLMFKVDSRIRKAAMAIVCFLPNLMMITTFFLQESVISFLIILSFYLYSKWWFSDKFSYIVLSVIASLSASVLHIGGIVVAVGVISLAFIVSWKEHRLKLSPLRIIFMIALMFVVILILSQFGDTFTRKLGGGLSAESITHERDVRESGGSGYVIGISGLPASLDLIINTPIRMMYFIFSPLPWTWRGLSDLIAFFGSAIFYIYTVVLVVRVIRTKPIKRLQDDNITSYFFVLLVIILIASIMFGWGVANAGSALRHREKFTYLFIVLFAISKEIILRTERLNGSKNSISDSSRL